MTYSVMSYKEAHKWEPLAKQKKVSVVARSSRGFMRAYERAGNWHGLDPWWRNRRNAFIKRHMAQVINNDEVLWKKDRQGNWQPSRRALALIMWAYMPPNKPKGAKPVVTNPRRSIGGSGLRGMSSRKLRSLGAPPSTYPSKSKPKRDNNDEASVRERLRNSHKFKKKDGTPDTGKINWFIRKLKEEGQIDS